MQVAPSSPDQANREAPAPPWSCTRTPSTVKTSTRPCRTLPGRDRRPGWPRRRAAPREGDPRSARSSVPAPIPEESTGPRPRLRHGRFSLNCFRCPFKKDDVRATCTGSDTNSDMCLRPVPSPGSHICLTGSGLPYRADSATDHGDLPILRPVCHSPWSISRESRSGFRHPGRYEHRPREALAVLVAVAVTIGGASAPHRFDRRGGPTPASQAVAARTVHRDLGCRFRTVDVARTTGRHRGQHVPPPGAGEPAADASVTVEIPPVVLSSAGVGTSTCSPTRVADRRWATVLRRGREPGWPGRRHAGP